MEIGYNIFWKKYKHLSEAERGQIEAYRSMNLSVSEIARKLGRSKSTISSEIKNGKHNGKYVARIAQKRAFRNSKKSHKYNKWSNSEILYYVCRKLKERLSPEIISHKLFKEKNIKFSPTSIYTLIKKHRPEYAKFLIHRGKKLTHSASVLKIPNRQSIDFRPLITEFRDRFGDWEADTVISARGGKSCLAVFVERLTRMYFIVKMPDKTADSMFKATMKVLKDQVVETITYDNGTENFRHEEVNKLLNCESYFCNPYHSWEKGSIENRNKILRQFLPKGTNFDLISEEEIAIIQNKINSRPMKTLNWSSPADVFSLYRSAYCFNVPSRQWLYFLQLFFFRF